MGPRRGAYHLVEFSPAGVRRLLESAGLEVLSIHTEGRVSAAYRVGASGYFDELKASLKRRRRGRIATVLPWLPKLAGISLVLLPLHMASRLANALTRHGDGIVAVARKAVAR